MKKLVKGILEFRKNFLSDYQEKYAHLAHGQFPDALFIGCSDSRVMPNLFASTNPGDLFVIRNVGNLVPPYEDLPTNNAEAAAIEFSLSQLEIKDIIVCGHSECGAMQAIVGNVDNVKPPHLKTWLKNCGCPKDDSVYQDVMSNDKLSPHNCLSQMNVLRQIDHLKTYPIIQERIENNALHIHGWYFDIATGGVMGIE